MRTCAPSLPLVCSIASALFILAAAPPSRAMEPTPIKLRVGGRDLPLSPPALSDGREVYIPLEALNAFGASARPDRRGEEAHVRFADGRTADIAIARPGGRAMLPLSELCGHLDADSIRAGGVCQVRARIRDLSFDGNRLHVATSFPLPALSHTETTPSGATCMVDLPGAALPSNVYAPKPPARENRVLSVQVQPSQDGVRILVGVPSGVTANVEGGASRDHAVVLGGSPAATAATQAKASKDAPGTDALPTDTRAQPVPAPAAPQRSAQTGPVQSFDPVDAQVPAAPIGQQQGSSAPGGPVPGGPSAQLAPGQVGITGIDFQAEDSAHARLRIATTARATASIVMLRDPARLAVDVPDSAVKSDQRDWQVDHPFISAIHAVVDEKTRATRIVLDLTRIVGYHVIEDAQGIVVDLSLPRNSGIRLSGATVVIDPGHGGAAATGCHSVVNGHTVYEKNLTLAVAKKVRELFQAAGANVLMTRTTDIDVPLKARPALANDNNAAVFVSIHVDDMPGSSRPSGSTAYYHFDDPSGRALAQTIIEQIGRVSGLPNRGARSDRSLYQSGLSVLRNSAVPATLVEMAFISNPGDRKKLLDEGFQQVMAQAIFDGVRAYLEGAIPGAALPDRIIE